MHPYDGSEKMTLYSAWLFATLTSPGTLATSTVTVVGEANGTEPRSLKVTDWSVPGSISWIFSVFVIGPPCDAGRPIVRVTGICTSCEMPPLWTVTWKTRLELVTTVFSWPATSGVEVPPVPFGSAATPLMFVPWRPVGVDVEEEVEIRSRICDIACDVITRSGSARKCEAATVTPWT